MDKQPRRRWFQFRLRTLLVLTAIAAVALVGVLRERSRIAEQQRVLRPHVKAVANVIPNWRDDLWGYDHTHYAQYIEANLLTDDDLQYLLRLPALKELIVTNDPILTGPGLAYLQDVPSLRRLTLSETGVNDAGLEHLAGVTQLEYLRLTGGKFTGRGFAHLAGLSRLKRLDIEGRNITDDGLEPLGRLTQIYELALRVSGCTDAGLKHLHSLKQLRRLEIDGRDITDAGLEELRRALPTCKVERLSRLAQ